MTKAFQTASWNLMGTSFLSRFIGSKTIGFVREDITARRLSNYWSLCIESISVTLIFFKRKWCILFAYRLPSFNKREFFNEISNTLSKALQSYNMVLAADLNIDLLNPSKDASNHLSGLLDVFNFLRNLLVLYLTKGHWWMSILQTNADLFRKTQKVFAGISNFYKLVVIVLTS